MTDADDLLLKLIASKVKMRRTIGTFVSASDTGCSVDVGGGRIPARFGTSFLPEVNESVNVWIFDDDTAFVMGATLTKPGQGVVRSVVGNTVTLNTDYGTVTAPFLGSAPAAGQVMGLRWHGGPLALGVMSTSPTPPAPPPPPAGSGATVHVDRFQAIDAGSWNRNGWQQSQVWASDSYFGLWLFGSKIADTIPPTAAITSVELCMSVASTYGAAPNVALHSYQSKPPGQPGYGAQVAIPATPGWVQLPASWGAALRRGGGAFGIGVNHGGKNIFRSLAQDADSGALRITSTY